MDKEEQRHKRRLRAIRERGKKAQRRLELMEAREKYMPRKKRLTTAKTALLYIFISCTAFRSMPCLLCGILRICLLCIA